MKDMSAESRSRNFLVFILVLQFIVCALVLFDVPVARQIIGFVYFTTIPGFVIIKLLKSNELDMLEIVLFSVGFSVAFLMIAGLLINEFCFLLGFSEPLSLFPLMMILNSFILTGAFIIYLRNDGINFGKIKNPSVSPLALLFLSLPVLSVVGAIWVNAFSNNLILLLLIITIALLIVAAILFKKMLPPRLYPFAILMIAISLLFHSSLISGYIVPFGSDANVEYFVFKTTANGAYWSSANLFFGDEGYQRINAMLSVTILPTIYSCLLNMDPAWIFKILVPLLFSLIPLALYQFCHTYLGRKYAFISAFLFMVQSTFYTEMLGLNRQMVAELFLALLLLIILRKKMKPINKMMCFMFFSVALITSHYALAEIFLFFISFALIFFVVLKWRSANITAGMVVFFFVVMFSWYIYTSNSATFDSFVSFGEYVYGQLGEFFNPASRGQTVLRGLGLESAPSIWNIISRTFAYLTQALIIIGFVGLCTKRTRIKADKEYFMFTIMAVVVLTAVILVPGLANTLNMTRFYHILLFFLAPLCVMGGVVLVKLTSKRREELKASILLLIILVPYFLFQTGFVYEVTGSESWSLPLSMYRMNRYRLHRLSGYTYTREVFGAQWMSENVDIQNAPVYADISSRNNILISHSMMHGSKVHLLSNTTQVSSTGTVYLNWLNIVQGIVVGTYHAWNTSELSPIFGGMNKIYSNGASEIYKNSLS